MLQQRHLLQRDRHLLLHKRRDRMLPVGDRLLHSQQWSRAGMLPDRICQRLQQWRQWSKHLHLQHSPYQLPILKSHDLLHIESMLYG